MPPKKKPLDEGAVESSTPAAVKVGKTVNLTFSTPPEMATYQALAEAALVDDRSIGSYIVRVLQGLEPFEVPVPAPPAPETGNFPHPIN